MPCLFEIHTSMFWHFIRDLVCFLLLVVEWNSVFISVFLLSDWAPIFHFNHLLNHRTNYDTKLTLFRGRSFSFVFVVRGGELLPVIMFRLFQSVLKLVRSRMTVACNKNNKYGVETRTTIRRNHYVQLNANIMWSLIFPWLVIYLEHYFKTKVEARSN